MNINFESIYKIVFYIISVIVIINFFNNILTSFNLVNYKSFFNSFELYTYIIVGFTTLVLLFSCFYNIYSSTNRLSGVFNILPIIFFITSLIYSIYINVNYKKEIIYEKLDKSFYTYNGIMLFVYLLQYFVLYINIINYNLLKTGMLDNIYSNTSYLLSLFMLSVLIRMFIILNYFRTDG